MLRFTPDSAEGDSRAIIRVIINLGQSLNMRTCAEGVETEAQLEHLRAEGCEEIQGFLFGRRAPLVRGRPTVPGLRGGAGS